MAMAPRLHLLIIIYYENRAQSTNHINTTIITPKAWRTRKPKAKIKLEDFLHATDRSSMQSEVSDQSSQP